VIKHKEPKQLYLDITEPNVEGNYYLMNKYKRKNIMGELVGEVPVSEYMKHPENYMTNEITAIRRTGWRKKKKTNSKIKRTKKDCKCKQ
jgi:hypothetical protein